MTDINLAAAMALWREGLCIIPTAGGGEKRPFAAWKEYQRRMPAREEVERWFATPRPGGIVCGAVSASLEVIDLDTPEAFDAFRERFGGEVPCERSPHGGHAWYRCSKIGRNARPAAKVDTRGEGGFCVVYEPDVLTGGDAGATGASRPTNSCVPHVTPEKRQEMLTFAGGASITSPAQTVRDSLIASGWKSLGLHGDREDFSRPGAVHPSRCDASLFDGQTFKVWSTTAQTPPAAPEHVTPAIATAAEVAANSPELPEAILSYCRRGSIALISANPKAGKTVLAIRTALRAAAAGRRVVYADLENGPRLWAHRVRQYANDMILPETLWYLDCTEHPSIGYIAAGIEAAGGGIDLLFIDPWGLLIAGDGVEDESSNALVSAYFLKMRRVLKPFDCATVILHHQPKSGANEKICFSGAGASSLQRYVQSICRIREDKGAWWFEAVCREFDEPFKPVMLRKT